MNLDVFQNNKYSKIYYQIIDSSKNKNRKKLLPSHVDYVYYERHHILPKSLGGSNDPENLVLLTQKEHYICHLLLIKMCKSKRHYYQMVRAFDWLSKFWNKYRNIDTAIYQKIKHDLTEYKRERMLLNPISKRKEVREKISKANKGKLVGDKNPSKRPEVIEKIKKTLKGTTKTAHYGSDNGFYGKTHTTETRQIMSMLAKTRVNIPPPPQHGAKNHFAKWYKITDPTGKVQLIKCMRDYCKEYNLCGRIVKQYLNEGKVPELIFARLYRVKNIAEKRRCEGYIFESINDPSGNLPFNE